jgi:hypothetical protein
MRADLLRFEAEAAAFIDAHRDMREASGFYGQSAHVFLGWLESRMGLNPHSPSKSLILLSGSQYFRYKSWC